MCLDVSQAGQAVVNNLLAFRIGAVARGSLFHSRDQGAALHGLGNFVSGKVQQSWSDVEEPRTLIFAAERIVGGREQEHSILRVVAGIRPSVVFLDMNVGVADGSNGTPKQAAKVDDQVGSN